MPAIRSGWPGWSCSAEFSWIDLASRSDLVLWMVVASLDPAFARIGIVQPTRHARAASQRESPAAIAVLKARNDKRIHTAYTHRFLKTNLIGDVRTASRIMRLRFSDSATNSNASHPSRRSRGGERRTRKIQDST